MKPLFAIQLQIGGQTPDKLAYALYVQFLPVDFAPCQDRALLLSLSCHSRAICRLLCSLLLLWHQSPVPILRLIPQTLACCPPEDPMSCQVVNYNRPQYGEENSYKKQGTQDARIC